MATTTSKPRLRLRVRELRELRGLTQAALAERAGLTQPQLSLIERGRTRGITFAIAERLAAALECDPVFLFASGVSES